MPRSPPRHCRGRAPPSHARSLSRGASRCLLRAGDARRAIYAILAQPAQPTAPAPRRRRARGGGAAGRRRGRRGTRSRLWMARRARRARRRRRAWSTRRARRRAATLRRVASRAARHGCRRSRTSAPPSPEAARRASDAFASGVPRGGPPPHWGAARDQRRCPSTSELAFGRRTDAASRFGGSSARREDGVRRRWRRCDRAPFAAFVDQQQLASFAGRGVRPRVPYIGGAPSLDMTRIRTRRDSLESPLTRSPRGTAAHAAIARRRRAPRRLRKRARATSPFDENRSDARRPRAATARAQRGRARRESTPPQTRFAAGLRAVRRPLAGGGEARSSRAGRRGRARAPTGQRTPRRRHRRQLRAPAAAARRARVGAGAEHGGAHLSGQRRELGSAMRARQRKAPMPAASSTSAARDRSAGALAVRIKALARPRTRACSTRAASSHDALASRGPARKCIRGAVGAAGGRTLDGRERDPQRLVGVAVGGCGFGCQHGTFQRLLAARAPLHRIRNHGVEARTSMSIFLRAPGPSCSEPARHASPRSAACAGKLVERTASAERVA